VERTVVLPWEPSSVPEPHVWDRNHRILKVRRLKKSCSRSLIQNNPYSLLISRVQLRSKLRWAIHLTEINFRLETDSGTNCQTCHVPFPTHSTKAASRLPFQCPELFLTRQTTDKDVEDYAKLVHKLMLEWLQSEIGSLEKLSEPQKDRRHHARANQAVCSMFR
jgi:hypothetical protein